MDATKFNQERYEEIWATLNSNLNKINKENGLPAVLKALKEQQFDQGFIQDDLKSVIVYQFPDTKDPSRIRKFSIQYNPKRALRTSGAGRKQPPLD